MMPNKLKIKLASLSVLDNSSHNKYVGPPYCTMATSHAASWWVRYADRTDRRTDRRHTITLCFLLDVVSVIGWYILIKNWQSKGWTLHLWFKDLRVRLPDGAELNYNNSGWVISILCVSITKWHY